MSFGEKLSFYRKNLNLTQEELAEKMFVTRQTVSRWETDVAFPDVETLIKLCDLLGCDMDTLVRDKTKEEKQTVARNGTDCCDLAVYDKHMNKFSLFIALGVGIIILGVTLMLTVIALGSEILGVALLLLFVGLAVADFIVSGLNHSCFMKENPRAPKYPNEQRQKFMKKFALLIAGATLLIFVAVIFLILINVNIDGIRIGVSKENVELLAVAIFMLLITASVFIYVYSGMLYAKYETDKYNISCITEGYAEDRGEYAPSIAKHIKIEESVSSIIMMGATITFLLLGFLQNLWHPAWIVFPIGGILCGIVSVIINAFSKK